MKKLLFLLVFAACMAVDSLAQKPVEAAPDLVVLKSGESIQCRVLSDNGEMYKLEIISESGATLPLYYGRNEVHKIKYGYFLSERAAEQAVEQPFGDELPFGEELPAASGAFRFRVSGGYSIRLGKMEYDGISHFRSGCILSVAPGYLFNSREDELGVTLDYRRHSYEVLQFSEKVAVHTYFIGPHWNHYSWSRHDNTYWLTQLALGYVSHYERVYDNKFFKVNNAGMKAFIGYGFPLGGSTSLELGLEIFASTFRKCKVRENMQGWQTFQYDDPQNISSIHFKVGLAFGK